MHTGKITSGTTSKEQGHVVTQRITRHIQLYLLFWVDEEDSGRRMFSESAQTRMMNIKNSTWFDEAIHKVYCPPIQALHEIKNIISAFINKHGGRDKAYVSEVGIFSHAALDGPITIYSENIPPVPNYSIQMAIPNGWDAIDFNWAKKASMCVFYGCNSGHVNGFAHEISRLKNFQGVFVWGQSTSTYPSFFPDKRKITLDQVSGLVWDFEPTYMVGGNENEGVMAMASLTGIDINPPNYFLDGEYKGTNHQGVFNDHRTK